MTMVRRQELKSRSQKSRHSLVTITITISMSMSISSQGVRRRAGATEEKRYTGIQVPVQMQIQRHKYGNTHSRPHLYSGHSSTAAIRRETSQKKSSRFDRST